MIETNEKKCPECNSDNIFDTGSGMPAQTDNNQKYAPYNMNVNVSGSQKIYQCNECQERFLIKI